MLNDLTKEIKMQRAFGVIDNQPRCEACGTFVAMYVTNDDDPVHENVCTPCFMRSIVAAALPLKKSKPLCRYCWKKRKLVGAWCRTCRNNQQRQHIKAALDKVKSGEMLTWQDEQTLAAAPHWAIWKKEFLKVRL